MKWLSATQAVCRRSLAAVAAVAAVVLGGCLSFHQGAMPGEPSDATFVTIDGVRVRYVDVGEGPTVVLLHGFASAIETWAGVMPALRRNHRVIALDLKGFGWTDRPAGDYSPTAQARLVIALLDERGVDRAAVVAHSWGASVALAMAAAAPERIERLALYDAWVFAAQPPGFFRWARYAGLGEVLFGLYYDQRVDERLAMAFWDPSRINQAFIDEVERALERPGTKAAALAATRGQDFGPLERSYAAVQHPVLLLWGRDDQVTPLHYGERLARTLPDARLEVYERCGHFPMIEASAASTGALVAFLGEAPR